LLGEAISHSDKDIAQALADEEARLNQEEVNKRIKLDEEFAKQLQEEYDGQQGSSFQQAQDGTQYAIGELDENEAMVYRDPFYQPAQFDPADWTVNITPSTYRGENDMCGMIALHRSILNQYPELVAAAPDRFPTLLQLRNMLQTPALGSSEPVHQSNFDDDQLGRAAELIGDRIGAPLRLVVVQQDRRTPGVINTMRIGPMANTLGRNVYIHWRNNQGVTCRNGRRAFDGEHWEAMTRN
jgi:hypothetical protein